MFLHIGIDQMVHNLSQLPSVLVQDGVDVGMHGIQGLDACMPVLVSGEVIMDTVIWEEAGSALDSNGKWVGSEVVVELW